MAITEEQCKELLSSIEKKCKDNRSLRNELNRLKKQYNIEPEIEESNKVIVNSKEVYVEDTEFDNDDEMSFYLDNYKHLDDTFSIQDIIDVLPTKDNYNYDDIVNRLIAESYKEIKEINELLIDDSLTKEELIECKDLITKEKTKIKYIREARNKEDEEVVQEHKNRIVLVPTIAGNIRVIDELEHIASEYYDSFLELINSIINGRFKNVKTFTSNNNLMGISEVKAFKIRVVFSRLDKNTYALITAFVKKSDNDKLYKETLTKKVNHFKDNEELLKKKLKDEEFMKLNDLYVEELLTLLGSKDKEDKKVNSHD